jgi:hypothetical protein
MPTRSSDDLSDLSEVVSKHRAEPQALSLTVQRIFHFFGDG